MTASPDFEEHQGGAYYRRLEVAPVASHDEIVHAYRRLALGVHPDAHPDDPEAPRRFREITEAYEVLADPARRQAYDRSRVLGSVAAHRQAPTATDTRDSSPVFLGGPRVRLTPGEPLWAGPVQLGNQARVGASSRSALLEALIEILDSWGVR